MVTNAGRVTACRYKFKAPTLKTESTKMKDLSKTWVSTGKQFEDFRQKKKQKQTSRTLKNTHLTATIDMRPGNQEELN